MTNHDPGDEDRRPLFSDPLYLLAFVADNGCKGIVLRTMTSMLLDEYEEWRLREKDATAAESGR